MIVISGFRSDACEICARLGHYATYSVNSIPTSSDNLSVSSWSIKKSNFVADLSLHAA